MFRSLLFLALAAAPTLAQNCGMPDLDHAVVLFGGNSKTEITLDTYANTYGLDGAGYRRGVAVRGTAIFPSFSTSINGDSVVTGSLEGTAPNMNGGATMLRDDSDFEYSLSNWIAYAERLTASGSSRVYTYTCRAGETEVILNNNDADMIHVVVGAGCEVRADDDENNKIDGAIVAPQADVKIHRRWHHAKGFIVARKLYETAPSGNNGFAFHGQVPTQIHALQCPYTSSSNTTSSNTTSSNTTSSNTTSSSTTSSSATSSSATSSNATSSNATSSSNVTMNATSSNATSSSNVTKNATSSNATSSSNVTKNASTSSSDVDTVPPAAPPARGLPTLTPPDRTAERSITLGVRMPENVQYVPADLFDAILNAVVNGASDVTCVLTTLFDSFAQARRAQTLAQQEIQVKVEFVDERDDLTTEEKLLRKCALDVHVEELLKQSSDEKSALRTEYKHMTGGGTAAGSVSKQCAVSQAGGDSDDDLSTGAIVVIVVGVLVLVGLVAAVVYVVTQKPEASKNEPIYEP